MHRESLSIIVKQDATIYSFIIFSADSSACFGWYPHPSSGARLICNYNIWHWSNHICYRPLTPTPPRQRTAANTVRPVPDVVITVWTCSWWWIRISSATRRAFCRKYKTVYSRIFLDNYWKRNSGLIRDTGKGIFLLRKSFRQFLLSNKSPNQRVPWDISLWLKRPGRESDR